MPPIYQQIAIGTPAPPCPCGEEDKYYFAIIDPTNYGYTDMQNWSIDGVDFIIGANGVMSSYGGSGQAYYYYNLIASQNAGYLAFFGKFSNLPQPEVKDPLGNVIPNSWAFGNGNICASCFPGDFLSCVEFEIIKTDANIYYLDLYWFDPYLYNTQTGYINNSGVSSAISIVSMNGSLPLDLNGVGADLALKAFLDPFYFNNVVVTLTATPTHINCKISNIYAYRCGFYDNASGKWKEMTKTLAC